MVNQKRVAIIYALIILYVRESVELVNPYSKITLEKIIGGICSEKK